MRPGCWRRVTRVSSPSDRSPSRASPSPSRRIAWSVFRTAALGSAKRHRHARQFFVDRETELSILNGFLRQVENGRGQAVDLVGEPGIGKSRLLAEFHRQLGDERVTWVEGRCLSYGTAIPYLLALDLLRSNCRIAETDMPDIVAEKVRSGLREVGMDPDEDGPVLLHLLEIKDADDSPVLSNPEAIKSKAFETLRQLSIKGSLR